MPIREPIESDTDGTIDETQLTILLADLSARQNEIQLRLESESHSYLTFFAIFITTIGTLAATDTWAGTLTPMFQRLVPSMLLLLGIVLLWLPTNNIHQQVNFRLIAVYLTTRVVPAIRELAGPRRGVSPASQLRARELLLSWETFRDERVLKSGPSQFLVRTIFVARGAMLYAPTLTVLSFYWIGTVKFASPKLAVLEWALLGATLLALALPVAGFLQLWLAPSLSTLGARDSEWNRTDATPRPKKNRAISRTAPAPKPAREP
jgi:hypothetical protein